MKFRLIICFLAIVIVFQSSCGFYTSAVDAPIQYRRQIIIDPGHGGIDGGAVGVDEIIEKDINLSLSLSLKKLLVFMGYNVIMTRESDISIHDAGAVTIRQKKASDLKNRLKIANQYSDAAYLSIHQNNFYDSSQNGMCFYYSPNSNDSFILATAMRECLTNYLQPENKRQLKKADSSLFIMYNAKNPAVLVECGFISNKTEAEKLLTTEYQIEIAMMIVSALSKSGM